MKPKIRLKGFQRDWERTPFADSLVFLKNNVLSRAELADKGTVLNVHYGDVLIQYNECVEATEEIKTFIKDEELAKKLYQSCAIKNGDIIFADAAEDCTVGKCTEVIATEDAAIVSGLHTIPCRPKKEFAPMYLGYYLNSCAYHDQLLPHIQGTKISSISKKALLQTNVANPHDKEEQQAIASCFKNLNSLIQSATKKMESLKQVKAASLQAMFPQEGETVPKVRFKGFEGEWEDIKLGEISNIYQPQTIGVENFTEYGYDVYGANGVIGKYHKYNHETSQSMIACRGSNCGVVNLSKGKCWINGNAMVINVDNYDIKKMFMFYLLQFQNFSAIVTGSGQPQIVRGPLQQWKVKIPCQKSEQELIANFFTALDTQITLQSQRVEKLKQIKSACLDQMFV